MKKLKQQFSDNLLTTPRLETQASNTIPVDLLIEIFSLVPAKFIARYRCLSKFWASILCRHDFTELFLTKSLTRPRLFFTFKANGKLFVYSTPQPQNPDDNSTLVATPYKSLPQYVPSDICTQVCGLVLLQGWKRKLPMICNPVTGQFLTLPKVLLKEKEKISSMYFGYDPIGKQFKVLCRMTSSSPVEINTHRVLTLESGKRLWRPVEYESHFSEDLRIRGQICINGVLYFGAAFGRSSIIVCFHVRSEKFVFIDADKDMERGNSYFVGCLTLFNYKGKLGIHDSYSELLWGRKELVFWVLEDAGNHKWSKHIYALSPLGKEIVKAKRFVGMTCTGEVVFAADISYRFYVFFYNLEMNTFTRVNLQGFEKFKNHDIRNLDISVDYVENLKFM